MQFNAVRGVRGKRWALITGQAFSVSNFRGPLIQEMISQGCQVYALAPDWDDKTESKLTELGGQAIDICLDRAAISPFKDALSFMSLVLALRRLKPEATLSYSIKPVIYGTLAAWFVGVPRRYCLIEGAGFMFSENASETWQHRLLHRIILILYRLALRLADNVIFLNKDDLAQFKSAGLVTPEKSSLLGAIGLDLDYWKAVPPVQKGPTVFILIARLLHEKGIDEYASAARWIKAHYPETRFLLLGGVDRNPNSLTEEDVRAWVEEDILEWHGMVPDVRPWLAQASVFVLPSYYREGVPRVIQEAMAVGRPVITTNMPGCRDTVLTGVNGFIVPPRDVDSLIKAMVRFIEERPLVTEMGLESRRLAEERYDVHQVNQRLLFELGVRD